MLGGPTLGQIAESRPIDVVYTWVNHADPGWQDALPLGLARSGRKRPAR